MAVHIPVTVRKDKSKSQFGTLLIESDLCPRCGPSRGHLISDHDEGRTRQCDKCACVTQDVH